ncbi:MAG: flippase [Rikenellaceae bacterium]|nr:flippase [Rikenellaceae bacterium]
MNVKTNILFSGILTLTTYIFPLITFPYISRVLGVEGVGICNFVDSIIHYFTMFSMMGISTIGIREISKNKNKPIERSKVFFNLLTLNLLTTILACIILIACMLFVPKLHAYQNMLWIGVAKIICNTLLIEWLYKGVEDFRYITIRSLIIRILYVVSVFLFIKNPADYPIYFALTTGMVVANAFINMFHCRKLVSFNWKYIKIQSSHLKSFITLGAYQFLTSMYISFNVTFLGFVSNDIEVGYYTTATKLFTIILSLFTAFTSVMLPRMSSIISEGNISVFKSYLSKSQEALFVFVLPLIVICEVFAPTIINIIAGGNYEGAITPMRIISPLLLIIGIEQILIVQILTPLKQDKAILINSIIGATLSVIFNIALVPQYKSIGSSIVWVICEVAVMISAIVFVRRKVAFDFRWKAFVGRIITCIVLFFFAIYIKITITSDFVALLLGSIIVVFLYCCVEYVLFKNSVLVNILNTIKTKCIELFQSR